MTHSSPVLILLLMFSGISTFILALYISQRRRVREGQTLWILLAAVAVWCFAYMLELESADLAAKMFWAKVKYFGILIVSPAWLILALQYTKRERWLKPRYLVLLTVMPAVNLALVWSSHLHTFYWKEAIVQRTGALSVLVLPVGPGFWLCAAYSYLLVLAGFLLFAEAFLRSNPLYKKQSAMMLLAALAPWAGNLLFLAGWTPLPHIDMAPFAFIITCLLFAWALFRLGLLDIVPIAQESIVEGINDSIIVLDRQNRIVECNPAAKRLLEFLNPEPIGKTLQETLPQLTDQFDPDQHQMLAVEDVELGKESSRRIYELRLSPLSDRKGFQLGKVLVLRDMTKHRLLEENAKQQNEFLRNVLESLTHPFYVLDAEDYTIKLANSAASPNGLTNHATCFSLIQSKDRPCNVSGEPCPLNQVKKTRKPVSLEHVREENDGTQKHFQVYGYPILDKEGNVVQMIEYRLDITNRRLMEEALRESEARLRTAIESLPFDFFMLDRNSQYVMQNSVSKKKWGNIIGKRPEELNVDKDELGLWKSNEEKAYRGETVQGEVRLKTGAEEKFYHNIIAPILDQGVVHGILGINIDITERKRMESELLRHRERLEELVKERTQELAEANAKLREEIEERQKQAQALRESEESYRNLFQNSIEGIFTTDLEGNFSSCNPAMETVLGYAADEILGKSYRQHVTPEDADMLFKEYNKLFQTGAPIRNLRYQTYNKSGEKRTLETSVCLIAKGGRTAGFQGTAADITEQVRAEDALMESEERYRLLVDNSLTAVYVIQDGKLRFANHRSEEISGYSPEELLERQFLDFVHLGDREIAKDMVRASLLGESGEGRFEVRVIHKNGAIRWLESFGSKIEYEGRPALLVNLIDVTERIEANRALRKSEERFRMIAETIKSVFWISGPGIKEMLYVNPAYEQVYGLTRESLYGAPQSFLEMVHPEDRVRVIESVPQRQQKAWEYEYRIIRPDGSVRWVRERGYPIRDERGNLRLMTGIINDITEQRCAEMQLKKTLEELEQRVAERTEELSRANQALQNEISSRERAYLKLENANTKLVELEQFKDDLINMVAHDMKNPVSSSMLSLDVIESEAKNQLSPRQSEFLRVAKRNQYKLSQMIANLLEISKLEDEKMQVIKLKVDMEELIARTLEPFRGIMARDCPSVKVSVAPAARTTRTDPYLLERIISNILSNAIKHSDSAEDILVGVERAAATGNILISIRDRGQGIPKEFHEKIFEKFFQRNLKQDGHRADTGLGLAFCRLAVEALGGKVWVESEPGNGSCFIFSLPDSLQSPS